MFPPHNYYVSPTLKSFWMTTCKCFFTAVIILPALRRMKGVSAQRQLTQRAKYMGLKRNVEGAKNEAIIIDVDVNQTSNSHKPLYKKTRVN